MPTAAELGRQVDEFAGMMSQYEWRREPWEGGGHAGPETHTLDAPDAVVPV